MPHRPFRSCLGSSRAWLLCAGLLLASCESEEGNEPSAPPVNTSQPDAQSSAPPEGPTTGDLTTPDAGESDAGPNPEDAEYAFLKAPAQGFRVKTKGREIPAKSDLEFCEVAELPGTPDQEYVVNRLEAGNGKGSHHLIVLVATPGTAADKKLRSLEPGHQTPCIAANIEFGEGLVSIAGSQSPYAQVQYPEGVGIKLKGGQRVVFDYHYFNYHDTAVTARSAIAVHTIPREQVKTIATGFAFTNMTIDTPPGTTKSFTAECSFKHDAMVMGVSRHTHEKSKDFTVWFRGGARDGQKIWTSKDWEHETTFDFEQPTLVKAGEGFKFDCSFENKTDKPLRFGIQAKDEMCILNGAIWSPTAGVDLKPQDCVISYVDENGIGRSASEQPFPKAKPEDAFMCGLSTFGLTLINSCVDCICGSCGTILAKCSADPDCKPIWECRSSCKPEENCDEKCEAVMFKHSSAVGMMSQIGICIGTSCDAKCNPAPTQTP